MKEKIQEKSFPVSTQSQKVFSWRQIMQKCFLGRAREYVKSDQKLRKKQNFFFLAFYYPTSFPQKLGHNYAVTPYSGNKGEGKQKSSSSFFPPFFGVGKTTITLKAFPLFEFPCSWRENEMWALNQARILTKKALFPPPLLHLGQRKAKKPLEQFKQLSLPKKVGREVKHNFFPPFSRRMRLWPRGSWEGGGG